MSGLVGPWDEQEADGDDVGSARANSGGDGVGGGEPEGEQTPKMMTVALHCRLAGKPARAAAFARFVDHVLRHDRV